jgi:hypothetical protein
MTDERNIAHDKKVAQEKKRQAHDSVDQSAIVPQPGKKPPQIDHDTDPSNSVARELYRHGAEPRVHQDVEGDDDRGGEPKHRADKKG